MSSVVLEFYFTVAWQAVCLLCVLASHQWYKVLNNLSVVIYLSDGPERSIAIRTVTELDKGADCAQ